MKFFAMKKKGKIILIPDWLGVCFDEQLLVAVVVVVLFGSIQKQTYFKYNHFEIGTKMNEVSQKKRDETVKYY